VGTFSRLEPGAGIEDLVRAAGRLLAEGRDLHLLVAGAGRRDRTVRCLVRDAGIARSATVTGLAGHHEQVIEAIDVFVHPPVVEWYGTALLEAMAAGRPVVATGVGGTFDLVREGETGLLAPRGDPESLADRIAEMLDDPEEAREAGRRGRLRAEVEFGADDAAERIAAVYRETLEAGG
jgi:glycosyltransferase involved in cell wall biosynthesis